MVDESDEYLNFENMFEQIMFKSRGAKVFIALAKAISISHPKELRNLKQLGVEEFKGTWTTTYMRYLTNLKKVPGMKQDCMPSRPVPTNFLLHWILLVTKQAVWKAVQRLEACDFFLEGCNSQARPNSYGTF